MKKIVVVGGGSAGGMASYTLKKLFPEKEIVTIKSKDIPIVGVGESLLGHFNQWLALVGLQDESWMKDCNSVYKLSIRFQYFFKKGDGGFHYPFGKPALDNTIAGFNDWQFKKILYPDTPHSNFAETYFPITSLVNANTIPSPEMGEKIELSTFNFKQDTSYQVDALEFGKWLLNKFRDDLKGTIIEDTVVDIKTNQDGIEYLQTKQHGKITADLFIDCTGFKSLLLGEALKEPFESYEDILINNSAWAARKPYTDKVKEMKNYTNCTAIENGWVWEIPLWNRMGTGYVYSDKFVSDEDALKEFQKHLGRDDLEFKNIKIRVGTYKRHFVKNVCAIGLSSCFIEPLESNGLLSIHEFLSKLVRVLKDRDNVSMFMKDQYNMAVKDQFRYFAEFVAMHYSLTSRNDTEYWRYILNKDYKLDFYNKKVASCFQDAAVWSFRDFFFPTVEAGSACIGTGMRYPATDEFALRYGTYSNDFAELKENWEKQIQFLNDRQKDWDIKASFCYPFEEYHRRFVYNDKSKIKASEQTSDLK